MKVRRNLLIALSLLSLSANAQRIKGSDTVLPVSQETAEIFMNTHPEQRVTVTGGGTGVAYPPHGPYHRYRHGFTSHQVQ